VECSSGCGSVFKRCEEMVHRTTKCKDRIIECKNGECLERFKAKDEEEHLKVCPFVEITCLKCSTTFERRKEAEHNCFESIVSMIK
jgi:hypothetical protein